MTLKINNVLTKFDLKLSSQIEAHLKSFGYQSFCFVCFLQTPQSLYKATKPFFFFLAVN